MITDYPLIAVTEVFDMPSVDNPGWGYNDSPLRPTEDILDMKYQEVLDYDWDVDTVIENPIHVFEYDGSAYGHQLPSSYQGRKIMGNGHHRLAFQAYVQGALFVHYTTERQESF